MRAVVLSVAGSDPSGGAGLQADLQVAAAHGVHAAAVPTLLTVQTSRGVGEVAPLDPALFRRSVAAVLDDLKPAIVKVGALGSREVIVELASALASTARPVVLDTVFQSSSGADFLEGEALDRFVTDLVPLAALLTPNLDEAKRMLGSDAAAPDALARECFERFGVPTLVKGGHTEGEALDFLVDAEGEAAFTGPRVKGPSPHGTGCALGMAIACELARGRPLREAVAEAKAYVTRAISRAFRPGVGAPFLDFTASDEPSGGERPSWAP